jgi:hypothetical protein
MNKKKKKNPAADNLIESLMNDLKDVKGAPQHHADVDMDSLFSVDSSEVPKGVIGETQAHRVDSTNIAVENLWNDLEQGIKPEGAGDASIMGGMVADDQSLHHEDPLMAETHTNVGPVGPVEVPDNFELPPDLPLDIPSAQEGPYEGPSAGEGGYQNAEDVFSSHSPLAAVESDETRPVYGGEDKTVSIQNDPYTTKAGTDADKTLAVEGFANAKLGGGRRSEPDVKVSIGQLRGGSSRSAGSVFTSMDASLVQAENLKLAQQRILELEKEVEKLRSENEELASAGEIIRTRTDEYSIKIAAMEKEKRELEESHQSEVLILKGNLQYKESEVAKARLKIDELETRLKADFKKIRVKERELENRLELVRAEKAALVRSKDEYILDMKRKIDQLQSELDNYRGKVLELNKTIESNQEQFKRTVRALRLALSNLEVNKEENIVPLKKAE